MIDDSIIKKCELTVKPIRKKILELTVSTGPMGAHIGGSLSLVEILIALYLGVVKYEPQNPNWENRDRVILSKGHGALALYPVLAQANIISEENLKTFKKDGSKLGGHPSLNGLSGIEFASGSLGQGLSLGVGTAIALKKKNNISSRVFVILGDGECNEGSIWEAAASASHFKLNNLIAIVDENQIQYDGPTADIMNLNDTLEKWKSFGWNAIRIDGHSIKELLESFSMKSDKPLVILAKTIKGKGISFMENNPKYHNSRITNEEYEIALNELENNYA